MRILKVILLCGLASAFLLNSCRADEFALPDVKVVALYHRLDDDYWRDVKAQCGRRPLGGYYVASSSEDVATERALAENAGIGAFVEDAAQAEADGYVRVRLGADLAAFERRLREASKGGKVLIDSWNDFKSGCCLLPDTHMGDLYLRTVAKVFGRHPAGEYVFTAMRAFWEGDSATNQRPIRIERPTVENVKYGSHSRQGIDIWLPSSGEGNAPLLVAIHGGGWREGDRCNSAVARLLPKCRAAGVALATIGYRLFDDAEAAKVVPPVTACVGDAIAAVRFLKENAARWSLDIGRIALTGGSAGACSALIAALTDDNSLGIRALLVREPQTSLDPLEMRAWIPNIDYGARAFGYKTFDEWLAHRAESLPWIERYSPMALVRHVTAARAPVMLYESAPLPAPGELPKDPTHAGMFCVKFGELCAAKGVRFEKGDVDRLVSELVGDRKVTAIPHRHAVHLYCTSPYGVVAAGTSPQMVLTNAPAGELAWELSDVDGRAVSTGVWPKGSDLRLPPLAAGYYRLSATTASGQRLRETTICALEPLQEKLPYDSPIGLMTALSYQAHPRHCFSPWNDGDLLSNYLVLLGWLGVSVVREISQWYGEAAPAPGDFRRQPETPQGRERALRMLAQAGIKPVLFNDQAYPDWVEKNPRMGVRAFPQDLKYVYDYAKFMAAEYGDWVFANEFSNEAICSSPESTWDYAACQKAAYLGFKDVRPDLPAVHGAFCFRMTEPFYASLVENGFFDYTDAFNSHTYGPYTGYPQEFSDIRELLERAHAADRQVWITEFCTDEDGVSGVPSVCDGFGCNYKAMTREQEEIVANFYAKAQIALMMQGVALAHWFVLPCYNERNGAKDWGLVRRDGTVKPVFWEFAQFVRKVGRARLEGEIRQENGRHAFLFAQPDGSQTAIGWSDKNPRVRYVDGLHGLKADILPRPIGKLGVPPAGANEDRRTIVQLLVPDGEGEFQEKRSSMILKGERMRVQVRLWNFDGMIRRGRLEVGGGDLAGVPDAVAIPAWGKASFDAAFTPQTIRSAFQVRFIGDDGRKSTPVRIDLFNFKGLCRNSVPLSVTEANCADKWSRNTNADAWSCETGETPQVVRMETSWRPGSRNRWTAPVLDLTPYRGRLDRAIMLEYEIRASQDKVENDFDDYVVMLVYDDVRRQIKLRPAAPTTEWTKVYLPLPEGAGSGLKALRIACCPKGNLLSMSVRNLRFYIEN